MPNYWIATYDGPTSSGTGSDLGRDIAVDTSGNCYVTGRSSNGSNDDIFLMKYSTSGILQWQRKLQGSSTSEEGYGVAVDSSGNCYITAFTFASGVSNDIVVAKYNTSGALLWQRFLGSSNTEIGYGIAVDSSGNCYVTGYGTLAAKDGIVTAKFNTSGTLQWQRRLESGSADCYGTGIAVDSSGNCYVVGQSVVTGVADIIVAKYNTSGTLQWQRQLASGGNDRGSRIAVDCVRLGR
jgi:hypothetical protein